MISQVSEEAIDKIASVSQEIPRNALTLLRELTLRNYGKPFIDVDSVDDLLTLMKVESDSGLNYLQCKLMFFLLGQPEYTARVGIITAILGVDTKYFHNEIEPALIKKHLLDRSVSGGRKLQRKGIELAANLNASCYQI